ncbi:hypothetical protein SLS55_006987 [Diplodia seriata]|uniref:Uncharacterized protein n=2 Tax=Diplodia seriata TaxID=420778 RepID=A0ABR3CB05_9PEZI
MPVLLKRDPSPWNDWVRWVVLVIIVVFFFLLFVPMWGTGWATRNGHGEPQYYGSHPGGHQQPPYQTAAPYYYPQQGGAAPAPPYSPPPAGGFYANHQQPGYDASSPYPQQPQPAYTHDNSRAGENVYEPPAGPPLRKMENGVIR